MTLKGDLYQQMSAEKTVEKYTKIAMATGAIPVPIIDIAASSVTQIKMIERLCEIYGIEYQDQKAKSITSAITTSILAKLTTSLVKSVPIIGYIVGMPTQVVLNGIVTYATGTAFIQYTKGHRAINSLRDIDPTQFTNEIKNNIDKGLQFVREKVSNVMDIDVEKVLDDKMAEKIRDFEFPEEGDDNQRPEQSSEQKKGPQMSNSSRSQSGSLPKGQEMEVIQAKTLGLFQTFGDAAKWFETPNMMSNGKTPQEYLDEGKFEEVNTWLNIIETTGKTDALDVKE